MNANFTSFLILPLSSTAEGIASRLGGYPYKKEISPAQKIGVCTSCTVCNAQQCWTWTLLNFHRAVKSAQRPLLALKSALVRSARSVANGFQFELVFTFVLGFDRSGRSGDRDETCYECYEWMTKKGQTSPLGKFRFENLIEICFLFESIPKFNLTRLHSNWTLFSLFQTATKETKLKRRQRLLKVSFDLKSPWKLFCLNEFLSSIRMSILIELHFPSRFYLLGCIEEDQTQAIGHQCHRSHLSPHNRNPKRKEMQLPIDQMWLVICTNNISFS